MSKKEIRYNLSQEDIQALCELSAQKGVEAFNSKMEKERQKALKRTDKVEVTKKLLREYRAVKKRVASRAIDKAEIPELRFHALEDLMGQITSSSNRTEERIQSRLNKQLADMLDIEDINTAYRNYHDECRQFGTPEDQRRCRIIFEMYMGEKAYTVPEIAEMEAITERTVYRDINLGIIWLSVYLFGFDK